MKGILEFTLPEDRAEFLEATKAGYLGAVINELDNFLRSKSKYENIDTVTIQEVRSKLTELINEYELNDIIF